MSAIFKAPHRTEHGRAQLFALLCIYFGICCLSFIYVTKYYSGYDFFAFDESGLYPAILATAPLAVFSLVFSLGRFSFGYLLGFYFYTMILGYLWLSEFSRLNYDHRLAGVSAFLSAIAFIVPSLLITGPVQPRIVLSRVAMECVLTLILIGGAVVVGIGALYHFRFVDIAEVYEFRGTFNFPGPERYAMGIFANALLPFAFAGSLLLGHSWRAAAALLLLLLFFPVTLLKSTLFGPVWLLLLLLLVKFFEARVAIVLSLLLPMLFGLLLVPFEKYGVLSYDHFTSYFGQMNFRMIAVPSLALDMYGDFFSRHSLTHFCQIGVLKPFMSCPYHEYLSVIMSQNYRFGDVNASMFATEGIASVGPKLAPVVAAGCGLVIALANLASSGLPARFILLSGGMLAQIFLNVPLTTTLLSYGAAVLFVLWYVTPRELFEQKLA